MPAILAALAALAVDVLTGISLGQTAVSLLRLLGVRIGEPAQAVELSTVSGYVQDTRQTVILLESQMVNLLHSLAVILRSLEQQIGSPQQSNKPVLLPPIPPPGYGGGSPSAVAAAVWAFHDPSSGHVTVDLLNNAAYAQINQQTWENDAASHGDSPWEAQTQVFSSRPPSIRSQVDAIDWTTILSTDATPAAWLNRVGSFGDYFDFGGGVPGRNGSDNNVYWIPWLTQPEFDKIKLGLFPTLAPPVPPVWPGISQVTLGTAIALSNGLLVPGPLSGVLVTVSSVTYPVSFYPFGPIKSYVKIGGIAFVDDHGQAEIVQPLGLETNVISPKTMRVADHAYIRLKSGTTGTVQPWLIN